MKARVAGLTLAIITLAGCASERVLDPSVDVGTGLITIQTDQTEYSWSSNPAEWLGVNGTLRNNSHRTLYARIGDAMNVSMDQELLYVAENADGIVEKQVAPRLWSPVRTGPLIEGAKIIAIRSGQTYRLTGNLAPRSTGTHRIRLDYSDQPQFEPGQQRFRDFSNKFVIR